MCRKKHKVKVIELKFLNICTEGLYSGNNSLDKIFAKAENKGELDQIRYAADQEGNTALHKACRFGNPSVVEWIIKKWREIDWHLDAETLDDDGFTPLFSVCIRGFNGSELIARKKESTKRNRLEIVKMLHKECRVNLNFKVKNILMTPLHWTVFNDDIETVKYLMENGAYQTLSIEVMSPVDVAGYCDTPKLVKYLYDDLR